ncbi:MAG: enoyl-CoA hydratase/isomerase family protein [Halorhabdus sp.]
MSTPVRYRIEDGLATVSIVDTDRRNVLTPAVVDGLIDALSAAEHARCLVLRGEGEVFCGGGDVVGIASHVAGDLTTAAVLDRLERIDDLIERLFRFPAPTVAAVDGPAFGTGGALVLACDLAVAATSGQIGFGFAQLGMAPAGGTSALLPRAVGPSTARELLFTGELLGTDRANDLGLFDRVYDTTAFRTGVASLVDAVLTGGHAPNREAKRVLRESYEQSIAAAMAAERAAQRRLLETDAHRDRVRTFLDGGGLDSGE